MTNHLNEQIKSILESADTRTYSVKFIKANGELRTMSCHNSVTKYTKGGVSTTKDRDDLFTTFSMRDKGYRNIPLDRTLSAKVDGVEYKFRTKLEG